MDFTTPFLIESTVRLPLLHFIQHLKQYKKITSDGGVLFRQWIHLHQQKEDQVFHAQTSWTTFHSPQPNTSWIDTELQKLNDQLKKALTLLIRIHEHCQQGFHNIEKQVLLYTWKSQRNDEAKKKMTSIDSVALFNTGITVDRLVTWLHALVHALTLDVSTKTQLLYNTSLCSCCCGSRSGVITTCENQGEGQGTETEKEVSFLRHGSPFRGSSSQVTLDPGLFNPSSCEGSTRVPSRRRGCLNHFGSTTNSIPMYHGPSLWLGLNSLHASIHVFEEFMESVMETKQQKTEPMGGSVVFNE